MTGGGSLARRPKADGRVSTAVLGTTLSPEASRAACFWSPVKKDIRFVASPPSVVQAMLSLARVGPEDVVFDLGCGDGRLVIAAAELGARAVGVDIDPALILRSRENARAAGQAERTEFRTGNLFDSDLTGATVVALYLLHSVNARLLPKLRRELSPGSRLVSHSFDMGQWPADKRITVDEKWLFLWTL